MSRSPTVIFLSTLRSACIFLQFSVLAMADPSHPPSTNWEFLGNQPEMTHHSDLRQIAAGNVDQLGLAWVADMPVSDGLVGNPLVKNGVVFQSGALGQVFANRLSDGKLLWSFTPQFRFGELSLVSAWATRFNRGVALQGDKVVVATGDCRVIALHQHSGEVAWESQTCDPEKYYGITAAPRVGKGLVFTGNACMDSGLTRGYVDALDAETGQRVWRFYTVPGPREEQVTGELAGMVARSWGSGARPEIRGCGSVWDAITYDPVLDRVYLGVAGPAPIDPTLRAPDAGDELFTNSIVALDASTGTYIWHFKQVPHDAWNFDSSVGIMVVELMINDKPRRAVVSVPKNGFVYLLDAVTGEFISGDNYVPVNWTKGLDENGRPIPAPQARYWETPGGAAVVQPGPLGSHNWEALAFSAEQQLLYIPASMQPAKISRNQTAIVGGVTIDFYQGLSKESKWKARCELGAWDLQRQESVWRVVHDLPSNGGLLHTSGNLVFQGTADGYFNAYKADDGKRLWTQFVGGAIRGAPATVMHDGEQLLLVPTGNAGSAAMTPVVPRFSVSEAAMSSPRLLAFKLGGEARVPDAESYLPVPRPLLRADPDLVKRGKSVYEASACIECHGAEAYSVRGSVPDLRVTMGYRDREGFSGVLLEGQRKLRGMPQYDFLSLEDVEALYSYINSRAWAAYEGVADK
jgi:quinohemoprotein ethanol dehydrogenase